MARYLVRGSLKAAIVHKVEERAQRAQVGASLPPVLWLADSERVTNVHGGDERVVGHDAAQLHGLSARAVGGTEFSSVRFKNI